MDKPQRVTAASILSMHAETGLSVVECKRRLEEDYKEKRLRYLESMNEELCKMVRRLMACMRNKDCDTCPYQVEPCDFDYDMRELGIEADE